MTRWGGLIGRLGNRIEHLANSGVLSVSVAEMSVGSGKLE
jgi:hypothetical protein